MVDGLYPTLFFQILHTINRSSNKITFSRLQKFHKMKLIYLFFSLLTLLNIQTEFYAK